jgi:hypothetical protein
MSTYGREDGRRPASKTTEKGRADISVVVAVLHRSSRDQMPLAGASQAKVIPEITEVAGMRRRQYCGQCLPALRVNRIGGQPGFPVHL